MNGSEKVGVAARPAIRVGHGHGAHDHGVHDHTHGHRLTIDVIPAPGTDGLAGQLAAPAAAPRRAAQGRERLFLASATDRLLIAIFLVAVLWLGVVWAMG